MASKPKILIFIDWFTPAFKAGGPIKSVSNIVNSLHSEFDFFIITSDQDIDGEKIAEEAQLDRWLEKNNCKVAFLSAGNRKEFIRKSLNEIVFSKVYFNSMYSKDFTLQPLLLLQKLKLNSELIIAPRGMLHPGALSQKRFKKKIFLTVAKIAGWFKAVTFHATNTQEENYILQHIGRQTKVNIAANLPNPSQAPFSSLEKNQGTLKMLCVSRIAPQKNVLFLLQILGKVQGNISFDIIGPHEDKTYVEACKQQIGQLPSNIKVKFLGAVPPAEITKSTTDYHLFTLPSKSENFGHAIFEALQMGKPVLIGKETPWQDLSTQKVGWDLNFEEKNKWIEVLEEAISWDQETYDLWAEAAWKYAYDFQKSNQLLQDYLKLFGGKLP